MTDIVRDEPGAPQVVGRSAFQAELDALRIREKAHTHEGDAIAAARRRLPMVEKNSWSDAGWAGCTSFATRDRAPKSSRLIGRRRAASR